MALAYVQSAKSSDITTSPATYSHTCDATTNCLVVGIGVYDGSTNRAGGVPTYGGVALTDSGEGAVREAEVGELGVELWYLMNPTTGSSQTLSVPNTGTLPLILYVGEFSAGTDSVEFNVAGSTAHANPTPSNTITTTEDGCVVATICGSGRLSTEYITSNQTTMQVQDSYAGTATFFDYTIETSAGSVTHDYNASSDDYQIVSIAFAEGAGGSVLPRVAGSAIFNSPVFGGVLVS